MRRGATSGPPGAVRRTHRGGPPRAEPAPELPIRHPAVIAAALCAAAMLALEVSFPMADTDVWQHLAVGRAMWDSHSIPRVNLWTWPTWGEPQVLPSWGFRALLWPFYRLVGPDALDAWRWLATIAVFGITWAAARRAGARGLTALPVIVLCGLTYRHRSQVRPETLAAVLLAIEIWLLERRRTGPRPLSAESGGAREPAGVSAGRDPEWWLVAIAWVWANVHISYYLGLVVLAIHAFAGRPPAPAGGASVRPRPLGWALAAAAAASFANPFGWRALAQPFEYFFVWRNEPLFRTIAELRPIDWSAHLTDGLPLVMAGWPLLALWRARRQGWDLVEVLTGTLFLGLALTSQRFLGPMLLVASIYLSRDLDAWVAARRWPAWTRPTGVRAGLAAAACAALVPLGWVDPALRPGLGMAPGFVPEAACDFVRDHGIRGRCFNSFEHGGYLLWRFWPDRSRLPFMDIHQTGTREDRLDYVGAMLDPGVWRALADRRRFDWALVKRVHAPDDQTLDHLDADSSWALVFADDVAALYVGRSGPLAAVADSFAYHLVPAGAARRERFAEAVAADPAARAFAEAELRRMADESPRHSGAVSLLASLVMLDERWGEARELLEQARRADPRVPLYEERMRRIEEALRAGPR